MDRVKYTVEKKMEKYKTWLSLLLLPLLFFLSLFHFITAIWRHYRPKHLTGMKIVSIPASCFLLMRSVRAGVQNNAFLQSIKRSYHHTGPSTADGPFQRYKQVLREEINRKKMSLAGDTVMLDRMMEDFYVPVYMYIKGILDQRQSQFNTATSNQPVFIGISAPQGCGKTTLTEFMKALFTADGKNCLSVSIDDFYLRGEDQDSLAARYAVYSHPLSNAL